MIGLYILLHVNYNLSVMKRGLRWHYERRVKRTNLTELVSPSAVQTQSL